MLQTLVLVLWFSAVAAMWLPNILNNQFLKNHDKQLTTIFGLASVIIAICYAFFV